jgi:putative hydrolase of the HAD superfamily
VHARFFEGTSPGTEALNQTIRDRLATERRAWVAARHRGPQVAIETLIADALRRAGLAAHGDAVTAITSALYEAEVEMAAATPPEPDMPESLAALRDRGIALAVVSNTVVDTHTLVRILEARALYGLVDGVYSSNDIGWRKPHPNCFLPALRQLDVEGSQAIFVGDRHETDVEGALELGMTSVLTHQYRQEDLGQSAVKPHHVITHIRDLIPLVDSLA